MLEWIVWLALVAAAIFLWRSRRNALPFRLAAATNALLAEHYLAAHDLALLSPFSKALADQVCDMCRASRFPNATDALIAEQFNKRDRFTQLNVIAMALHHGGVAPPLPWEVWRPARNPFVAKRDRGSISAVSVRLHRDHGVKIEIGETRLRLIDGRVMNS